MKPSFIQRGRAPGFFKEWNEHGSPVWTTDYNSAAPITFDRIKQELNQLAEKCGDGVWAVVYPDKP